MSSRVATFILAAVLGGLAVALLVARAALISTINVNWDEFHFLGQVHKYLRGDLVARLLTFHVHLFSWAPGTSGNEALQVLRIREVMFAASIVTAASLAYVGWRLFRSVSAALFAIVASQSTSYVLHHGSAARFDPLASAFFAIAAALLASTHLKDDDTPARGHRLRLALAGLAFALAALVTIKSFIVFLPALAAIVVVDALAGGWLGRLRLVVVDIAVFGLAAALAFGALFLAHASSLARPDPVPADVQVVVDPSSGGGGAPLLEIFERQFPGKVLPAPDYLVASLQWDWPFWLLLLAGGALAFMDIGAGGARRRDGLRALLLLLPLATVTVYRNAFSYFYVCVLPFAALLGGLVAAKVERRLRTRPALGAVVITVLAGFLAVRAAYWIRFNGDDHVTVQAVTVDVVHEVFPEPVPYIDRCNMIGSFEKKGPFMSTWVIEDYRRRGTPIMPALLERERPRFLLQNVDSLELADSYSRRSSHRLLKEDFAVLRESFIPHWGPLWVAGKTLDVDASEAGAVPQTFSVHIGDRYVVEWAGDGAAVLAIDGAPARPGDLVELAAGDHVVTATLPGTLTLRTSSARPPPRDLEPLDEPIFQPLRFRTTTK